MSAALCLLRLLDECAKEGIPAPKDTGHIRADEEATAELSGRLGVPAYLSWEVFGGVPVKQAWAVYRWALVLPDEERIRALRSWERKNSRKGAA